MSPQPSSLSATLKIMVLSNGDNLSNNILWAEMVMTEMVMGQNGHGPKCLWAEITRNIYII